MQSLRYNVIFIIMLPMLMALSGCAEKKFAELYIVTPERSVDVYSASNGSFLGITPLSKVFETSSYKHDSLVFPVILVRDGYKTEQRVVLITGWMSTKQDAMLMENRTELRVDMHKLDGCNY